MEPRFGRDFSDVRVHTDAAAAESARNLSANAYTTGSDIYFAAGKFAPSSPLLAHELTHVVQQSSGRTPPAGIDHGRSDPLEQEADRTANQVMSGAPVETPAPTAAATHGAAIQRDGDTDDTAADDDVPDFDPQETLDSKLALLDELSDTDEKLRAQNLRLKLLLTKTAEPDWKDFETWDKFYDDCEKTSRDEQQTIDALGADLNDAEEFPPEAFPIYWSEKLQKAFELSYPIYTLRRDIDSSKADFDKTGQQIPKILFDHGLPLDFPASLSVKSFQFLSPFGAAFGWAADSAGFVDPGPGPLAALGPLAMTYLNNLNQLDFYNTWFQNAKSVVQQVRDGEISVNPAAFEKYTTRTRIQGVGLDMLMSSPAGIPEPLQGRVDPMQAELYISQITGLMVFAHSFMHARELSQEGTGFVGQADSMIAAENPLKRQFRAQQWGHEKGFYSDALLQQASEIWEHKWEIAESMGKDIALFAALEAIPGVNVLTTIYLGLSLLGDAWSTMGDIAAADDEARNAQSVAQLQKAAADQAKVASETARKIAEAVAMHYATKGAKYVGGKVNAKVDSYFNKDEPTSSSSKSGAPDEAAKANEKVKEEAKKNEAEPKDPLEKKQGEHKEPLEKGEARITAEGRCKICHSPCKFEMDMARDVVREAKGTPYAGYAENLANRVRLLDDAMTDAVGRKMPRDAFAARFGPAFAKISKEVDSAYDRIVNENPKARNPALDEIEGFQANDHGMMNDTKPRWDPEKANEGTAYHDRVKARIQNELPRETVFTEDTIQDYMRRQGVPTDSIPGRSSGIDLYIIDNQRNLIIPVDITSVSGGRAHVGKMLTDVERFRSGVERTGMHVADPIEIEYIGKNFDQASASIINELRAYARPPR